MRVQLALLTLTLALAGTRGKAEERYAGWCHSGSIFVLTTPDGADLPASATLNDFPLLVRLHHDFFDFRQARAHGEDLRFATPAGDPLPYQIDNWDAARGEAAVWVRVAQIRGNARQELRVFWGNAQAKNESSGSAVFNESNGYRAVMHMGETLSDEAGQLALQNVGTHPTPGLIGTARRLAPGTGIFCGDHIKSLPSGAGPHSSEAWFRPTASNGTIMAWGNEQAQGKVVMQFRSPPHVNMDCYFSAGNVAGASNIPLSKWVHVVHTYENKEARLYVNGVLDGVSTASAPPLNISPPTRLFVGGWYNTYTFAGDIDDVRISDVARSADWVRLEYENQKPLQTLVGILVQPGDEFSVSQARIELSENQSATLTARAGGATKLYWVMEGDGPETIVAVDRFSYSLSAGRVARDTRQTLHFKAVYPNGTRTIKIPVTIHHDVPNPRFTLDAPRQWNGRDTIEIRPLITNAAAMNNKGAADLHTRWRIEGGAVVSATRPDALVLKRSQFTGTLHVTATIDNGGPPVDAAADVQVIEPARDPWIARVPEADEKPQENQFYARDDSGEGTLFYNGKLDRPADSVFLRLYASDKLAHTERQVPGIDKSYRFETKLKAGLVKYKIEFGTTNQGVDTVLQTVGNLVCGDAYLIQGQSNALATDTREESPRETSEWIRSYRFATDNAAATSNLWCFPVWRASKSGECELGYWGMELAKRLVASQQVPIFIVNGAVGGTRIDQHQRNNANPLDPATIYGRTLWRLQHARLTHGIRAVLWHQGENDQGADGPTGTYGYQSYRQLFIDLSAAWIQDYPNVRHFYVFQIWPDACSMGDGTSGDMLREVQRNLPSLYSHLSIMSTVGVRPSGGCHYPLEGWAQFALLIQPLLERDLCGRQVSGSITPPNLRSVAYANAKDTLVLQFDQPVVWVDGAEKLFFLDDAPAPIRSADVSGNTLTLKINRPVPAKSISYLLGKKWNRDQSKLLYGTNHIAALTFCDAPILPN